MTKLLKHYEAYVERKKKIYLIRHSIPEKIDLETALIPLAAEGVVQARAKRGSFSGVKKCYSSYYKRAVQTAELLADDVVVMDGLHERIIGYATEDFWLRQYQDYDYCNLFLSA